MLLFEIKIILTVFRAYFVQCSYAGGWTFAIPLIITLVWEASMFVLDRPLTLKVIWGDAPDTPSLQTPDFSDCVQTLVNSVSEPCLTLLNRLNWNWRWRLRARVSMCWHLFEADIKTEMKQSKCDWYVDVQLSKSLKTFRNGWYISDLHTYFFTRRSKVWSWKKEKRQREPCSQQINKLGRY